MTDIIEKDSFFKQGKVNASPYRHYINNLVWIVRVWRDDRPVDEETATLIRIIAHTAQEAASEAINSLDSHIKAQKEAAKLRDEIFKRGNSDDARASIDKKADKAFVPMKKCKPYKAKDGL